MELKERKCLTNPLGKQAKDSCVGGRGRKLWQCGHLTQSWRPQNSVTEFQFMSDLSQWTHLPMTSSPLQRQQLLSSSWFSFEPKLFFSKFKSQLLFVIPQTELSSSKWRLCANTWHPSVFQSDLSFFLVPVLLDFCHFLSTTYMVFRLHGTPWYSVSFCEASTVKYLFLLLVRLPNF